MFIQLYYCTLFPVPSVPERFIQLDDVLDNQRVHPLQKYDCLVPAITKNYLDQVPKGFRIFSILLPGCGADSLGCGADSLGMQSWQLGVWR